MHECRASLRVLLLHRDFLDGGHAEGTLHQFARLQNDWRRKGAATEENLQYLQGKLQELKDVVETHQKHSSQAQVVHLQRVLEEILKEGHFGRKNLRNNSCQNILSKHLFLDPLETTFIGWKRQVVDLPAWRLQVCYGRPQQLRKAQEDPPKDERRQIQMPRQGLHVFRDPSDRSEKSHRVEALRAIRFAAQMQARGLQVCVRESQPSEAPHERPRSGAAWC